MRSSLSAPLFLPYSKQSLPACRSFLEQVEKMYREGEGRGAGALENVCLRCNLAFLETGVHPVHRPGRGILKKMRIDYVLSTLGGLEGASQ